MQTRLQSALEYVTTYGWAILIIAIALVALILLGVFNTNAASGTYCVANTGYSCSNPVLNSSGFLSILFSETPYYITITGTACQPNQTTPTTFLSTPSPISVAPEEKVPLLFICPLPSTTLGSHVIETLWVRTDPSGDPVELNKIGTVSVSVSTNGSVAAVQTVSTSITGTTSTTSTSSTVSTTSILGYYACGNICNETGYVCPEQCPVFNNCESILCPATKCEAGHQINECLNLTSSADLDMGSFYACAGASDAGTTPTWNWTAGDSAGPTIVGQSSGQICSGEAYAGTLPPVIEGITVRLPSRCLLCVGPPPLPTPAVAYISGSSLTSPTLQLNYTVSSDGSYVVALFAISNYTSTSYAINADLQNASLTGNTSVSDLYTEVDAGVEDAGTYHLTVLRQKACQSLNCPSGPANASIEVLVFPGTGSQVSAAVSST